MDTEGAFDDESTLQDCNTVFALSALISSVTVIRTTGEHYFTLLQGVQRHGRCTREQPQ